MNVKIKLTNGEMKRTAGVEFAVEHLTPVAITDLLGRVQAFVEGRVEHTVRVETSVRAPDSSEISKSIQEAMDRLKTKQTAEVAAAKAGGRPGGLAVDTPAPTVEKPIEEPKERPHQLPYVNESPRMGVSLAEHFPNLKELIEAAEDAEGRGENKPHFSGIKFSEDGVPRFKVRYFCKDLNCQGNGMHYVYDNSAYVRCHKCNTYLKLRPASTETQRTQGSFLIADQLYVEGMTEQWPM